MHTVTGTQSGVLILVYIAVQIRVIDH